MGKRMTCPAARVLSMCLVLGLLVLVTGFSSAQTRDVATFFIQEAKLTASDGAEYNGFGSSVSISGDTLIVGTTAAGSAYVFERDAEGLGNWVQVAKLTIPVGSVRNGFGESVSISGDTVVVGARGDQYQDAGSVYVYQRDFGGADNWGQVAKLTASDGIVEDYFGESVSVSDDTVVVGALNGNDIGHFSGAAYVFEKPAGGWTDMSETAKLTASDGAEGDHFGGSVSISGNTVVVGAYRDGDSGEDSGSAYLFERPELRWSDMVERAKLTASDGAAGDYFGQRVSISGDTVVAGAYRDDDNGDSSGSAYLFEKPETGWADMTETTKLVASDGSAGAAFGRSVSMCGDTVLVGAIFDDVQGSAYLFQPDAGGTGMIETAKLTPSDGATSDWFGWSVAIDGDTMAVGARGDDDKGEDSGSAYVFIEFEPIAWVYLPVVLR